MLNGIIIPFENKVKDLGLILDNHLDWTEHVTAVCQRVFFSLHSLKRMKDLLPFKVRKMLVQQLIIPLFDYCDVVYGRLSGALSNRLQRAQNACVRFIMNIPKFDHITPAFRELNWLKLKQRRSYHSLILLHKIIYRQTPSYLTDSFQLLSTIHNIPTRAAANLTLKIPNHKSTLYNNSFVVSTIRAWNSLPSDLRDTLSEPVFKKKCWQRYLDGSG